MEDNAVTKRLAVLEDEFGLIAAVDAICRDGRVLDTYIDKWLHDRITLHEHIEVSFMYLFKPDNDLNMECKRAQKQRAIQLMHQKGWNCFLAEVGPGSEIFDFYIYQNLESNIKLNMGRRDTVPLPNYLANPSWYDYVREKFIRVLGFVLGFDQDSPDKKVIGRYLLTEPKFEQRFNEVLAKYGTLAAPTSTAMTSAQGTTQNSSEKISKQQTYAMMMAPQKERPSITAPTAATLGKTCPNGFP